MNIQKLGEAIGNIEEDFIYEYQSFQPKSKSRTYAAIGVLASCAVLSLAVGITSRHHSGRQPVPSPNIPDIAWETYHPTEQPSASEAATEVPDLQTPEETISPTEEPPTESSLLTAENEPTSQLPASTAPIPTPSHSQSPAAPNNSNASDYYGTASVVPSLRLAWNQVTACSEPYTDLFMESVPTDTPSSPDQIETPTKPGAVPDGDSNPGSSSSVNSGSAAGSSSSKLEDYNGIIGCYWLFQPEFSQMTFASLPSITTVNDKQMFSCCLYTEEKSKLYMVQVETNAASLEEANRQYPQKPFENLSHLSYLDSSPLYLVENEKGECYARLYKDQILITIWEKGIGRDGLIHIIRNLEKRE